MALFVMSEKARTRFGRRQTKRRRNDRSKFNSN
jgi:hypothetical protein